MKSLNHPALGRIEFNADYRVWAGTAALYGHTLGVDIHVDGTPPRTMLDQVAQFITRLTELDRAARDAFTHQSEALEYVSHHLAEVPKADLVAAHGESATEAVGFVAAMHPVRLAFDPADPGFGLLDYTIGEDLTNYLLCVRFDEAMSLISVEMES